MITEHCSDLLDLAGLIDFLALRCVLCGELVDPVILENRQRIPMPAVRKPVQREAGGLANGRTMSVTRVNYGSPESR